MHITPIINGMQKARTIDSVASFVSVFIKPITIYVGDMTTTLIAWTKYDFICSTSFVVLVIKVAVPNLL